MRFLKLEIEQFLAISHAVVSLDSRGLVLIQGSNEDDSSANSNGAGKSTIADALCWCLYGETARGESGDAVINRKAGKGTKVCVTIEDDGKTYAITRHRKHKTGKNALAVNILSPTIADLTKGTDKLTQALVNELLGCSYEVFRASIYAGQESFPDLPGMTDKNLKTLIEQAAGTTVLEKAYELARSRLNEAKAAYEKTVIERSAADIAFEDAGRNLAASETDATAWETYRTSRINAALDQARDQASKATTIVIDPAEEARIVSTLAAVETKIASVDAERKEELRLIGVYNSESRNVTSAETSLNAARADAKRKKDALDNVNHKVGCPCEECGRPYGAEDLAAATDLAKKALVDALTVMRDARAHWESAQKSAQSARDALDAFRATMTDLTTTNAQRASLLAEKAALDRKKTERKTLVDRAREFKYQAEQIKTEENPHLKTKARFEKRVKEAQEAVQDAERRLIAANVAQGRATSVAEVFNPAGVRAHILDDVTPFLNAQTSKYLSVLSDGNIEATWSTLTKTAKGELREKFAIEVTSETGGEKFGLISGGEKRKVRLAAALALQDLVASRAVKPIELFFGDEIDDALDDAGLERLMTILEEKARERGTVMVISHRSLRDWISQVIMVTKKDGEATIEEINE